MCFFPSRCAKCLLARLALSSLLFSSFVFCFLNGPARVTNLREPAGLAVILKGLSPLTLNCYIINNKHFVYFKSERVWCECADIFISVHKMSMRPCFACTFYVSFSGRSEFVVLKWSSEVLSFFIYIFLLLF